MNVRKKRPITFPTCNIRDMDQKYKGQIWGKSLKLDILDSWELQSHARREVWISHGKCPGAEVPHRKSTFRGKGDMWRGRRKQSRLIIKATGEMFEGGRLCLCHSVSQNMFLCSCPTSLKLSCQKPPLLSLKIIRANNSFFLN